ncbi:MAG: S41 family peptidase [Defluviitaleaceae bacterium]|nr:S41 family peptidase [Defluviitaleaceae bacterium]MCL2239886.1 S41 family peptidase [Defluviitaleaceae bacterium]
MYRNKLIGLLITASIFVVVFALEIIGDRVVASHYHVYEIDYQVLPFVHPPSVSRAIRPVFYVLDYTEQYEARVAIHRFNNMSRADMLYDFEYLMTILEENWPFFNLSISANGVDVRELADEMRRMLHDPSTPIRNPIDFLYLVHEYFMVPINQLGHLSLSRCYEGFFQSLAQLSTLVEQFPTHRSTKHNYATLSRPEVLMFYSRLRDSGRGTLSRLTNWGEGRGPAMEFDILEAGSIAYIRVERMMGMWFDPQCSVNPRMLHYERLMYEFNKSIAGYGHLIFDFRGNTGGMSVHFRSLVMPHLLNRRIRLPGYVFYMDGYYANLAREIFCMEPAFLSAFERIRFERENENRDVQFDEPLPYLDTGIGLVHAFRSAARINPRVHYMGARRAAGTEIYFNGKIWLLTDERTGSAAEEVVAILKYNNIATLVGEPTWGIMGSGVDPVVFNASLPNTGIRLRFDVAYYTDPYGRPWQGYGIQPHYPNRPGMDALETVLAMIAEMER